jgi:arabinose-5-phosphate isomerase
MTDSILKDGKRVIAQESAEVSRMGERMGDEFVRAVELILACTGRVILTGMGKSGHVAKKLAATFTSTGAPAFFLHPAEGAHGDLGLLQKDDLLIALSKSGSTTELEMIFPAITRLGLKTILLTGQLESTLAKRVTVTLDCTVTAEACPHNLAPTTSASAAMVMGHALAVAALQSKNFSSADFANLHPAGSLGQRLLLCVRDKMHTGAAIPLVKPELPVRETILEITGKRLGCALVSADSVTLSGIFTDGDLRRMTQREEHFLDSRTDEAMTTNPLSIGPDALLDEALALMEEHAIMVLPVLADENKIVGVIHLHDVLGSGPVTTRRG